MIRRYRCGTDRQPRAASQAGAGPAGPSSAGHRGDTYSEPGPEILMGGQAPEFKTVSDSLDRESVSILVVGRRAGVTIQQIAQSTAERLDIAARFLSLDYEVSYGRGGPELL